jgi:hypothetical protein
METDLIQDGGQVKTQTDIDHHGPKYILIICHLPDPPIFSLPTTFKIRLIHTLQLHQVLKHNVLTFCIGLHEGVLLPYMFCI